MTWPPPTLRGKEITMTINDKGKRYIPENARLCPCDIEENTWMYADNRHVLIYSIINGSTYETKITTRGMIGFLRRRGLIK